METLHLYLLTRTVGCIFVIAIEKGTFQQLISLYDLFVCLYRFLTATSHVTWFDTSTMATLTCRLIVSAYRFYSSPTRRKWLVMTSS